VGRIGIKSVYGVCHSGVLHAVTGWSTGGARPPCGFVQNIVLRCVRRSSRQDRNGALGIDYIEIRARPRILHQCEVYALFAEGRRDCVRFSSFIKRLAVSLIADMRDGAIFLRKKLRAQCRSGADLLARW